MLDLERRARRPEEKGAHDRDGHERDDDQADEQHDGRATAARALADVAPGSESNQASRR